MMLPAPALGGQLAGRLLAPQRLALQLNEAMFATENQGRFASFVCGQIDPSGQKLQLVNCGHLPLLLISRIASQTRYQRRAGLNIVVLVFHPERL